MLFLFPVEMLHVSSSALDSIDGKIDIAGDVRVRGLTMVALVVIVAHFKKVSPDVSLLERRPTICP